MTDFHDYLLKTGFTVSRTFDQKYQHFRLEYIRAFFGADIVVCPVPCVPPITEESQEGKYHLLTPEEQVNDWSDIEWLRSLQTDTYSVWLQDHNNRVHLATFGSIGELELLFKLCRVDLPL